MDLSQEERLARLREISRQQSAQLNSQGYNLYDKGNMGFDKAAMGAEMAASIKPQMAQNAGDMAAANPQLTQTPTIGEGGFQMPSANAMLGLSGQLAQMGQLEPVPMLQMQRGGGTYVAQPPQMQSFTPPMPTPTAEAGDGQDQKGLLAMLDELMKKKGAAAQ